MNSNQKHFFPFTLFAIFVLLNACTSSKDKDIKLTIRNAYLLDSPAAELGEGAIWDPNSKKLLWIDILGKKFYIYDSKSNIHEGYELGKMPGTIVPGNKGDLMIPLEDGLYRWNIADRTLSFVSKPSSLLSEERFNDGKCDPSGRLWVGSMRISGRAGGSHLYRYDPANEFVEMVDSVSISNGIAWSGDKSTLFYIDTPTGKVVAYDYDDMTGNINNKRTVVTVPDTLGHPDGMTIDSEDRLWVALWGGHGVGCFDPINGELLEYVKVPVKNVTSCAFGGDKLDILYITTAKGNMEDYPGEAQMLAGRMFYIQTKVKGVRANIYRE